MPDHDLITADGPLRVFELVHDARPLLLNLGQPGDFDIGPCGDRVQLIDASYEGEWELPVLGVVRAPTAVLIRADGYVAWVGEGTEAGLADALATWFGAPTGAEAGSPSSWKIRTTGRAASPRAGRRTRPAPG